MVLSILQIRMLKCLSSCQTKQRFFPIDGLPPPWGGTYKGASEGPLSGSNPIQDAACLKKTNKHFFFFWKTLKNFSITFQSDFLSQKLNWSDPRDFWCWHDPQITRVSNLHSLSKSVVQIRHYELIKNWENWWCAQFVCFLFP